MYPAIGPSAKAVMFLKLPAERPYSVRFVLHRWPVLVDGLIWRLQLVLMLERANSCPWIALRFRCLKMLLPVLQLLPSLAGLLRLPPVPPLPGEIYRYSSNSNNCNDSSSISSSSSTFSRSICTSPNFARVQPIL